MLAVLVLNFGAISALQYCTGSNFLRRPPDYSSNLCPPKTFAIRLFRACFGPFIQDGPWHPPKSHIANVLLLCPLARNFVLRHGGDFWWILSGLRLPQNEARKFLKKSGKIQSKIRSKIRDENSKNSGTFVLQLFWPNVSGGHRLDE